MSFNALLGRRVVDCRHHKSVFQNFPPQRFKNVFGFAQSRNHNDHMSFLPRQFICFYIFDKSLAAFLKRAFMPAYVPIVQQPELFRSIISLDSPFLVKKDVFPGMAPAEGKKVAFHDSGLLIRLKFSNSAGVWNRGNGNACRVAVVYFD